MFFASYITELQEILHAERRAGRRIGFVPTMGALHPGHLSLIERALQDGMFVVCSIFVNPTQFNDKEDFRLYPRTLERDALMLQEAGCHLVFAPSVDEIYPDPSFRHIDFDPGPVALRQEGASRPGHFAGMAAVVKRLFDIVQPDAAYFGQKDFQQFLIIRKMVEWYRMPLRLVMCPIFREPSGLAMSSRNVRLDPEDRERASLIYKVLRHSASALKAGIPPMAVKARAAAEFERERNFQMDYFDICSADDLSPVTDWIPGTPVVLCTAVIVGGVRLIDNILLA